jgi:uncharacterized repeat protein (TIGR02543 family)
MKENKKSNFNKTSIYIVGGVLLVIVIGFLVANIILKANGSGSFFANVNLNKSIRIDLNQNLFVADKNSDAAITGYNESLQIVSLNGELSGNNILIGKLNNFKFKVGEKYKITIKYVGGDYNTKYIGKKTIPNFTLELQKNNTNNSKKALNYATVALPTARNGYVSQIIEIKSQNVDATGFNYLINNGTSFNNYRFQIFVTKIEPRNRTANGSYGELPIPEKPGFEFLGWYDSLSGNNKIMKETKIIKSYNHTLYAHWQKKNDATIINEEPEQKDEPINNPTSEPIEKPDDTIKSVGKVNYDNFKWTEYKKNDGPVKNYTTEKINPYGIYAPEDISDLNGESLPLIVLFHGSEEFIGQKNQNKYLDVGFPKVIKEWKDTGLDPIPAIVVAAHGTRGWWAGSTHRDNEATVEALIKYAVDYYKADPNRIVFMGHSAGGFGAVEMSWSFKDKVKISSIVTMSSQQAKVNGNGAQEYFSNIRMRGYGEIAKQLELFKWVGQPDNFTYYKGEKHGNVPRRAMLEDANNDGVSDLIYWLFGDYAKTK